MADINVTDLNSGATQEDPDSFGPSLDHATIERVEKCAGSNAVGINRRLCLTAHGSSAEQLKTLSKTDPEAFGSMLDGIGTFLAHARGLVEVAEAAQFRMRLADSRENSSFAELMR